ARCFGCWAVQRGTTRTQAPATVSSIARVRGEGACVFIVGAPPVSANGPGESTQLHPSYSTHPFTARNRRNPQIAASLSTQNKHSLTPARSCTKHFTFAEAQPTVGTIHTGAVG